MAVLVQKMGEALPSGPDFLALHFDPGKEGFVEKLYLGVSLFIKKFAMMKVFKTAT